MKAINTVAVLLVPPHTNKLESEVVQVVILQHVHTVQYTVCNALYASVEVDVHIIILRITIIPHLLQHHNYKQHKGIISAIHYLLGI